MKEKNNHRLISERRNRFKKIKIRKIENIL